MTWLSFSLPGTSKRRRIREMKHYTKVELSHDTTSNALSFALYHLAANQVSFNIFDEK
jgi:hypothetical protein